MIKIFIFGKHAKRLPFSYSALSGFLYKDFCVVGSPCQADAYVSAHILDVENLPKDVIDDWRVSFKPMILLSEEPFWDTIWARQPIADTRLVYTKWGPIPVFQLNHQTSTIFKFDKIPYYLLTNHRFAFSYASMFYRNRDISPSDWRAIFERRVIEICFMFERRPEAYHSVSWPEAELYGLCSWRTQVADQCRAREVRKFGRTWEVGKPARQELTDWHLDKLVKLNNSSKIIFAVENTHQPQYITEKLFDAFACGAMPVYYASPSHLLGALELSEFSYLNLFGLSPIEAAKKIEAVQWNDRAWSEKFYEEFSKSQKKLSAIFCDPRNWVCERNRVREAIKGAFSQVLATAIN